MGDEILVAPGFAPFAWVTGGVPGSSTPFVSGAVFSFFFSLCFFLSPFDLLFFGAMLIATQSDITQVSKVVVLKTLFVFSAAAVQPLK